MSDDTRQEPVFQDERIDTSGAGFDPDTSTLQRPSFGAALSVLWWHEEERRAVDAQP